MASRRRSQISSYRTYGNVAYAPIYSGGNTVRSPSPKEIARPKPRVRPKERPLTRTQVRVREAGRVSVFAVIGFVMVGVFAALLLLSHTQYTVVADEVVSLRQELNGLLTENAALVAKYEQVFDLERIQQAVGSTMSRPTASQIEYIDLSEPDSVELLAGAGGGILDGLRGIGDVISDVIEYFR